VKPFLGLPTALMGAPAARRPVRVGHDLVAYKRVCVETYRALDHYGKLIEITRGKVYLTSKPKRGLVTVYTDPMVKVPRTAFAGDFFASTTTRSHRGMVKLQALERGS
jgi:hypothetical protein